MRVSGWRGGRDSQLCAAEHKGESRPALWQELRGRTRVTINHPDLPDSLKQIAAEAVQTVWQSANEAAMAELATLRAETRHAASEAEAERDAARVETAAAREDAAAIAAQLAEARQAPETVQADLAAERQAHAATQARLEAGRTKLPAPVGKDYYADLDARLKKFEPQQASVEDRQGTSQPGEKPDYDAALKHFHAGDFKSAGNSFSSFIKKYPQSPYLPLAQYWLGNSL